MLNWRVFISAFFGRIASSLFIGVCIVLGFGPTEWAEFLISGMPTVFTPGIARLGLLLIASVALFVEWRAPLQNAITEWSGRARQLTQIAFAIACCLPFVTGAFYITAKSMPPDIAELQRQLTAAEAKITGLTSERALSAINKRDLISSLALPQGTQYEITIGTSSTSYSDCDVFAQDFAEVFSRATGWKPFRNTYHGFINPRLRGLWIVVADQNKPPPAATLVRDALDSAKIPFQGITSWEQMKENNFALIIVAKPDP